jgi:ubiquinone/menaquinone biosynthesis C-methylase UbiE
MSAVDPLGELNTRYEQQATWTRGTRQSLFGLAGIPYGMRSAIGPGSRVLDIGCGTGAVAREILSASDGIRLTGVDIDLASLRFARQRSAALPQEHRDDVSGGRSSTWGTRQASAAEVEGPLAAGDAHALPFGDGSFDAVFFHFVLLWLREPLVALAEAARVTRPGGHVIAVAEPDHEARIDAPEPLEALGRLQTESLRRQGADVRFGRKLPVLLAVAGLADVRFGVIGGEWQHQDQTGLIESEWSMLERDLGTTLPMGELDRLERLDRAAWEAGRRVLFVPTFFGIGRAI